MYKILIADDEAIEREALSYFIKKSNLEIEEIIECANGTDAVKKVMLERPDIILLDINMPGLSGLEAMERIRMTNYRCKVIFSTAFNYFEYAIKALQLGAMDFMVKPVKEEQLITVLTKAIDHLDEEYEKESENAKLKDIITFMGKRIIGDIIQGNINEEVLYYFDVLGIPTVCSGNCFCIKFISEIYEEQEHILVKLIKKEFALREFKSLINFKNQMITIIAFNHDGTNNQGMYLSIKDLIFAILKQAELDYILGIGLPFQEIYQIERSYSQARTMMGDMKEEEEDNIRPKEIKEDEIPVEIQNICNFITDNFDKKINLDDIAEFGGFSKYHICRLFKQYVGSTIVEYLIQVRINRARELLKNEKYSIKQISDMVGYSNPNYFTWAFKKIEGISPMKYRYSE